MKLNVRLNTLFADSGNISATLSNGKQRKIERRLKTLASHLSNYGLIAVQWVQFSYFNGLLLMFSHGTISSVSFAADGTIRSVYHENYLQTKLAFHRICGVEILERCILISYIEPYLTHISLEGMFKPNKQYFKFKLKGSLPIKTVSLDRGNRNLSKRNLIVLRQYALLWWNTTLFANYPGNGTHSPNLLLFDLHSLHIVASDTIEGEIIKNNFVQHEPNKFGVLCRPSNNSYSLTYLVFEIGPQTDPESVCAVDTRKVQLKPVFSATIPLDKSCMYAEFTSLQDKILLLCDDESVMLFNIEQNVLYSLHSSMPVCYLAANPLDAIFVTSNQHGRLSIYDYAFNNIAFNFQHELSNSKVSNLKQTNGDICTINYGMSIKRFQFLSSQLLALVLVDNKRLDSKGPSASQDPTCQLVLLTLSQPVDFKLLTHEYLHVGKYEEALNILRIINWNCSFEQAYYCLNVIFEHFLKLPLDSELESQIESTLATFLIPCTPIDYKIFERILPFIRHLAIRFFYHLIRHHSYTKAYQLGIELKSRRHFLLLYQIAKQNGLHDLMTSSYRQAQMLTC